MRLILLLLLLLLSCTPAEVLIGCVDEEQPDLVCTMEMDLVCGCNGTSYVNPCHAERAGVLRYRPQVMDEPLDVCRPW